MMDFVKANRIVENYCDNNAHYSKSTINSAINRVMDGFNNRDWIGYDLYNIDYYTRKLDALISKDRE